MDFRNTGLRAMLRAAPLVCGVPAAYAHTPEQTLPDVVVREAPSVAEKNRLPLQTESVTAGEIADKVNLMNTEDAIKYLPSLLVRKRHVGDTQAPFSTRTSGVGSSARGLIYADGVLLSALIGNNNSAASPKWGMVAPDEIGRIDVMYGPFAAAYPGNSIGAVVEITTRMPRAFEGSVKVEGSSQRFSQYATTDTYNAYQASALMGNRNGNLSWWLSANHLDSRSQPLAFVTAVRPAAASALGTPVSGAYADLNRTGAPIQVIGAGGIEHHLQDNFKVKVAYDFTPTLQGAYSIGLFQNDDKARVQTYLRDSAGNPVYATSTLPPGGANIGGFNYTIPDNAFSSNYYNLSERHWMQSLALRTATRGEWDWEAIASTYRYGENIQRNPTGALPNAASGGPGTITLMDRTAWSTLDLKGFWRPQGYTGAHQVSFGAHRDYYRLVNPRYNTSNWISGGTEELAGDSRGKTQTDAVWLQDAWTFARGLKATLGGRYEHWRAYDGFNYSLAPALLVNQPEQDAKRFSPKASVAWTPTDTLLLNASVARAYRFPTVTELYQAITTGAVLSTPNPNLRPERAWSGELSAEQALGAGRVRVSLFEEHIADALVSQSGPLGPGPTLVNFVQNVDQVRSRGVELVAQAFDVVVRGLELAGSVTYVDSRIRADAAFPAAVGKRTPQVPRWRATAVATYHLDPKSAFTLAGRYSDRVYATADNSDVVTHTYQGFDPYFVMDARFRYQLDRRWGAAVGVDNLNNRKYFLFHPFPQRTVVAELKFMY